MTTTTRHGGLGWKPDKLDIRDHMYRMEVPYEDLPQSVDLRDKCPPVYDQQALGSCTANAIAGLLQFDQMKQGEQAFTPSRLFIYYNERDMEGTVDEDAGAMIRDGIKSVAKLGACPETEWSYDISKFADKPAQQCYTDAVKYEAIDYQKLRTYSLAQMQACLAAGFPFVFGFRVYESFESDTVAKTGIVPMPRHGERFLGGHAVDCVGYDISKGYMIIRNSWGSAWGIDGGYCYMPLSYFTHSGLTSDLWTIRTVM